ncbi:TPA: L antigen family, member 3-like [Bos taurus]|nr:TPA: L antigen family, member 3-like [Bos taurus]
MEGRLISLRPTETPSAGRLHRTCLRRRAGRGRHFRKEQQFFSRSRSGRATPRPGTRGWSWRRSTAAMQETGWDVGAGSLAGGAESRGRRGVGGGRGGPRSAGAASAADHGAPGVAPAQHSSGLGGDPWSPAQRPGSRPCVFTLSVPFPSALEAEIARGSLAPDVEPHRGAVGKELTVSGSVLVVCWRAEDCRLLRISIVNFLDQLSLVMRTMQRFGPSVAR